LKVLKIINKYIEIIKYFYNSIDVALDTLSTSDYNIDSEDSYAPPELFSDSSSTTNSDTLNSRSVTGKL